ncbi:glycosyl hydrolase [Prevotella sp. 10(H)]|uniref:glycosyl hydrolase n=1 Tax=Prevotella sp. 10(H) TaxID=1158294 RepID=UPI0004A6F1BF|nr:glycosyl hydrolase [Prevotella sp. 10(H)]
MKQKRLSLILIMGIIFLCTGFLSSLAQVVHAPFLPSKDELYRPFGEHDRKAFAAPPKVYYPETWFHYIGGNVSKEGITRDLEAVAKAGISGIQLFHGQFGGPWPGVEPQIACLSPLWDDAVRHTADECKRLGLRLTMLNCPGWATSGGPWIEESNAMRHLAWSRTDIKGGTTIYKPLPVPEPNDEPWRDYKDITVLAFPTPLDDTDKPLVPQSVKSSNQADWQDYFAGKAKQPIKFAPTTEDKPHWVEVTFPEAVTLRSVEFPAVNSFNHPQCYEPGVSVKIQAILPDGSVKDMLATDMPQENSQGNKPITLACSDVYGVNEYRISIVNKYNMALSSLRLFSAARKNSWESEAGWVLRRLERAGAFPEQSPKAFISPEQIVDLTAMMDKDGNLKWTAPTGNWTVLRIGHVNTGEKNGPAPAEGKGWECNKLSKSGPKAQFDGYIGRLIGKDGPLANGQLEGMLIDSWECYTQTWTDEMEAEFKRVANYQLRKWLPAVFGYVIKDHETTTRFLYDWRATINDLFANNFYGGMAELAHQNGLYMTYETAAGDVFPADILEYFKYADVPMCEFWQPITSGFVGSPNFKPIKPAASAARLYGKTRLAAEAFTSFSLTWDEHFDMLKEVANINTIDGVTHLVFHTYTHNPQEPFFPPGTSFGSGIGTPFLRGQTWWKFMPELTSYLSRCSYMLERGKPVSDVLWYLGDEINQKPNQNAPFPQGFKYDYCNPDILLNRISVKDGMLVTPEGISYRVLWIPDAPRMLPQTIEKIYELVRAGATIVGNAPEKLVTLTGGSAAQKRFDTAVNNIWGKGGQSVVRKVGRGLVFSNTTLDTALDELKMTPDVTGGDALWAHRQIDGADWYFVCAPKGRGFKGALDFRSNGNIEIWDPVTGESKSVAGKSDGNRTSVELDLPQAGSCFVVFRKGITTKAQAISKVQNEVVSYVTLSNPWTLSFPTGWGAPQSLQITDLKPWKDLDISDEGKAFSGTATYSTSFDIGKIEQGMSYTLDLGQVDMIAAVSVNGKQLRTLWAPPYCLDLSDVIKVGKNTLTVEVTSTWFNRLVYDANQPEKDRKTWTINGPRKDSQLKETGLLGPVKIIQERK